MKIELFSLWEWRFSNQVKNKVREITCKAGYSVQIEPIKIKIQTESWMKF